MFYGVDGDSKVEEKVQIEINVSYATLIRSGKSYSLSNNYCVKTDSRFNDICDKPLPDPVVADAYMRRRAAGI